MTLEDDYKQKNDKNFIVQCVHVGLMMTLLISIGVIHQLIPAFQVMRAFSSS